MAKQDEKAGALPPQFKSFNKINATGARGNGDSRPILTSSATGNFRLNNNLVELLKLKSGAGVAFHFDDSREEWYMERDDKDGFVLRDEKEGCLQFNSTLLLHQLQKQFKDDMTHGRMAIATEPTRIVHRLLYPVLTSSLHQTRKPRS